MSSKKKRCPNCGELSVRYVGSDMYVSGSPPFWCDSCHRSLTRDQIKGK